MIDRYRAHAGIVALAVALAATSSLSVAPVWSADQAGASPNPSAVAKAVPGQQQAIDAIAKAQDAIGRGDWETALTATGNASTSLLNADEVDRKDERLQNALQQLTSAGQSLQGKEAKAANDHLSSAIDALAAAPGSNVMSGSSTKPETSGNPAAGR